MNRRIRIERAFSARSGPRVLAWAALTLCGAWLAGYEIRDLAFPHWHLALFGRGVHLIGLALAAAVCLLRGLTDRRERAAWILIGLGCASWTAGEFYFTADLWNLSQIPVPSWADVGYLGFIPLTFIGIGLLARQRLRGLSALLWIDAIAASLAVAGLSAAIVFGAIVHSVAGTPASIATNLAYPVGDLLLLGLLAGIVALSRWRVTRTWLLLGAGILMFCTADSQYLLQSATASYAPGGPFDAGWWGGILLLACAAWTKDDDRRETVVGEQTILAPLAFGALALGVLIAGCLRSSPLNPLAVTLASGSLTAIGVRLYVTFRQNQRMLGEVRRRERVSRLTFETSPVGVARTALDGRCLEANQALADMLGYSREELRRLTVREVTHPAEIGVAGGGPWSTAKIGSSPGSVAERRLIRADGEIVDVIVSAVRIEAEGSPGEFHVVLVDITDRKRAEAMFRDAVESAPDAMVIIDGDGMIALVNEQAEKLFGYARENLVGERVGVLMPDRFRLRHAAHVAGLTGDPANAMQAVRELIARRHDGSEFEVEISLKALQTASGAYVSASIRDITDRKRRERETAHRASVVEQSHDAIISKDLAGIITSWNPGAERLYGHSETDMLGRSLGVLVPAGHEDELPAILARVCAGERIFQQQTVRQRNDGTQVHVSVTISPIRDRAGAVIGASSIARDISAHLDYQEQLRVLSEQDTLTGVRNRRRFEQDVAEQLSRARRYGERAGLLCVDIDQFKQINDTYGHAAGDLAIKQFASCLLNRMRDSDVVGRIGGDEFAVLLRHADERDAAAVSGDLRRVIAETGIALDDGTRITLSASIGHALIDDHTTSYEAVFAAADKAMYAEKRRPRRQTGPKPSAKAG